MSEYVYGWLCLSPYGSTNDYGETFYTLPKHDQEWGDWMIHPNPAEVDGNSYGAGRYRINIKPTFDNSVKKSGRWLWHVRAKNVLGKGHGKFAATEIQLRRVNVEEFAHMIRSGLMKGADLSGLVLRDVDLQGADLSHADLSYADLNNADLRNANLSHITATGIDLIGANLSNANLQSAYLSNANLSNANLTNSDLSWAKLYDADLRHTIGYVKP